MDNTTDPISPDLAVPPPEEPAAPQALTDDEREAAMARYLAQCSEKGTSPFGANRHARRTMRAVARHAVGNARKLAHEKAQKAATKARSR